MFGQVPECLAERGKVERGKVEQDDKRKDQRKGFNRRNHAVWSPVLVYLYAVYEASSMTKFTWIFYFDYMKYFIQTQHKCRNTDGHKKSVTVF